jgi:hypothetical protein
MIEITYLVSFSAFLPEAVVRRSGVWNCLCNGSKVPPVLRGDPAVHHGLICAQPWLGRQPVHNTGGVVVL